jgi:hypothetical protein
MGDFLTLQKQYAKLDWTSIQGQKVSANKSAKPPACSAKLITTPDFTTNFTLPSPPPGAQDIIDNGVNPAPTGKLVDISSWVSKYTVKNPDGSVISNLAVKPLADDAINRTSFFPPLLPGVFSFLSTAHPLTEILS